VTEIRKYIHLVLLLLSLCSAAAHGRMLGAKDLKRDAMQADPISGLYWVRVPDAVHPGAPPKLVRLDGVQLAHGPLPTGPLCVHAGDHLRLHEGSTALHSMTIDAVSFQDAACGNRVHARVGITGKLVDVLVTTSSSGVLLEPFGVSR
jgi:hypothetical protein